MTEEILSQPFHKILEQIDFKANPEDLNPELFNAIPKALAQYIAHDSTANNKYTQIRKFYDEIARWQDKLLMAKQQENFSFNKYLPLIKMLNAKTNYAFGRKASSNKSLISEKFVNLIETCLNQIEKLEHFQNFKTFFEAFMGFYRVHKED